MGIQIRHAILVRGDDLAACIRRVEHFFTTTKLVGYDAVEIDTAMSCSATEPQFFPRLEEAIGRNRQAVADLLDELRETGCESFEDLARLPQGAGSKLLHTVVHLLDGFFGIDSSFFDLDDATHWLPEEKRHRILREPHRHHLLLVTGISSSDHEVPNLIGRHIK